MAVTPAHAPLVFGRLSEELCGVEPQGRTAAHAEIATLLRFGSGHRSGAGLDVELRTAAGADRLAGLMNTYTAAAAPVRTLVDRSRDRVVRICPRDASNLVRSLGMITRFGDPVVGLPPWLVTRAAVEPTIAAAALRGAVLAAGRISCNHMGGVTLSVASPCLHAAVALRGMARHVGAKALIGESTSSPTPVHTVVLRNRHGLDLALSAMGASDATTSELNPRSTRRRSENTTGLNLTNRERVRRAAAATVAWVRVAVDAIGDDLPADLAVVAYARLEYPEESMEELGQRCGVTKNVISYRLRKLQRLADEHAA